MAQRMWNGTKKQQMSVAVTPPANIGLKPSRPSRRILKKSGLKQVAFARHVFSNWNLPKNTKILWTMSDEKWWYGLVLRTFAKMCPALGIDKEVFTCHHKKHIGIVNPKPCTFQNLGKITPLIGDLFEVEEPEGRRFDFRAVSQTQSQRVKLGVSLDAFGRLSCHCLVSCVLFCDCIVSYFFVLLQTGHQEKTRPIFLFSAERKRNIPLHPHPDLQHNRDCAVGCGLPLAPLYYQKAQIRNPNEI
jgi:hypothetical protein